MSKHVFTHVSEFVGGFPDIPVPPDVDVATLERDGEAPFWVTLPIVPDIGQVSGNGLLYDDALVAAIEEQINRKRPGGNFGHLAEEVRDIAFPHPKAFWVAAMRVGQTLWAKCYIPAGEAREHLRSLKAVGGRIATSIFGKGDFEKVAQGVKRLVNFELETVDFAPPERAALGYAAPVIVTAEMATADEAVTEQENLMAEVTELAQVSETLRAQIIAEYEAKSQTARQIAELTTARDEAVTELEQARTQLKQLAVADMRRTVASRVAELTRWEVRNPAAQADVEALRRTVVEYTTSLLGDSTDQARAERTLETVWQQMKPLAETLRDKLAGPAAVVNGRVRETTRPKLEVTPEATRSAVAKMGIQV